MSKFTKYGIPLKQRGIFFYKNAFLGVIVIANPKACCQLLDFIDLFFILQVYFVKVLQCPCLYVHHPEEYSLGN